MRYVPYWLNIGSILHQYGCATRADTFRGSKYTEISAAAFFMDLKQR